VIVAHACDVTSGKAADAASAQAAHVAPAKAADVASAKPATHVASAEPATHVASAKSATHVATATATATATTSSLSTRSKKTPGKHRACQNHHHSSSHDFLHLIGRTCRHRTILKRCYSTKVISNVTMKGDGSAFLSPLLNFRSINQSFAAGKMRVGLRGDRSVLCTYRDFSRQKNRTARIGLMRAMRWMRAVHSTAA
jgi:hypothetical protein